MQLQLYFVIMTRKKHKEAKGKEVSYTKHTHRLLKSSNYGLIFCAIIGLNYLFRTISGNHFARRQKAHPTDRPTDRLSPALSPAAKWTRHVRGVR